MDAKAMDADSLLADETDENEAQNTINVDEEESIMDCATVSQQSKHADKPAVKMKLISEQFLITSKTSASRLLYLGKVDLPQHPVRMRYMPSSTQRFLLYGKDGYQEMTVCEAPGFYTLQDVSWENLACDCVQTNDQLMYVIARCHTSAVLACYDEFLFVLNMVEIRYPLGCISSLATDLDSAYIYGTNEELNCVIRFSGKNLDLINIERFGNLWRPFDCCVSQGFTDGSGKRVQFLFVSNIDAGICVFDMNTMEIVAECGDDLSPGAKYLTYDPKRSFLFVTSTCDRLLRCYRFGYQPRLPPEVPPAPGSASESADATAKVTTPGPEEYRLKMMGEFLVSKRQPGPVSYGPQCLMWDPETNNLAATGWSQARGKFCIRVFNVSV